MTVSVPFHGVLLDMDGTLVNTEPLWLRTEQELMADHGVTWTPVDQARNIGVSAATVCAYMARRVQAATGADVSPAHLNVELWDRMLANLRAFPPDPQPGAAPLLTQLRAAGVPMALVSSSSRRLMDAVLAGIGDHWFDLTISADDVDRHKPDPWPYTHAADRLGIAAPWCLAFEDSPPGVASARAAGAFVIAIPHAAPIPDAPRSHVITSLLDVDLPALAELFTPPA